MLSGLNINFKLFPAMILLWWGTVLSSFAANRIIVDAKPFADGFVMASADGMIYWTDADGVALDSVRLKMDLAGIEVRDGRVLAVSPDCRIMSVERNGKSSRLCNRQITRPGEPTRRRGRSACWSGRSRRSRSNGRRWSFLGGANGD